MNEAAEKRFRRQVLAILQAEHTDPEGGWMGPLEVLTKLGHGTPGEVSRAVDALVQAGLAERWAGSVNFRSRGTTATRGFKIASTATTRADFKPATEETPVTKEQPCKRRHEDPADAKDRRREYLRSEALKFARDTITHGTPGEVVAAAETYEAYLSGQAETVGPDAATAAELLTILYDARGMLADQVRPGHEIHARVDRGIEIAEKIAEDAEGTE